MDRHDHEDVLALARSSAQGFLRGKVGPIAKTFIDEDRLTVSATRDEGAWICSASLLPPSSEGTAGLEEEMASHDPVLLVEMVLDDDAETMTITRTHRVHWDPLLR